MDVLQQRVESQRCDVLKAELKLQEAELELTHGDRFMSEAKEKYGKLKIAVELAKVTVHAERAYLSRVEEEAANGFTNDA